MAVSLWVYIVGAVFFITAGIEGGFVLSLIGLMGLVVGGYHRHESKR